MNDSGEGNSGKSMDSLSILQRTIDTNFDPAAMGEFPNFASTILGQ